MLTSNLHLELDKTNALFSRWSAQQRDWLQSTDSEYGRVLEECDSTASALADTDRQLEASRPINQAIKLQQKQEMDQQLLHSESQRKALRYLETQLTEAQLSEQAASRELSAARAEHDSKKSKMEQALRDLTYGTKYFALLGLDFQKAANDCMKFLFSHIDRSSRVFYLLIFVDASNAYQVVETNPPLDPAAVATALAALNASNDIGAFVVRMRGLFKELC